MRTIDLDDNSRVIVLGEGQVGSAICRSLVRSMPSIGHQTRTDWASPETAATTTADALAGLPRAGLTNGGTTTVVWSAGTAGMTTTKERCEQNLATMQAAVSAALDSIEPGRARGLHIISSAGAHAIDAPRWPSGMARSSPESMSKSAVPYVQLKFDEETWSRKQINAVVPVDVTVHRVASVYARPGDPGRSGMVAAMVRNASRGQVTSIFGNWSTIRNYVHADDVGEFVARSIRLGEPQETRLQETRLQETRLQETLLADRRSYAIGELVHLVSRAIRRPVPLKMVPVANAQNHTFNPAMIADGFAARPLATAIRQMFVDLQT